ncbi:hypothetical protein GUJ93_ZPchr0011g27047 [Zizania palustris]|uniref:Uncharacterized protein n=1 Tax=Zizania palustris TaxID=103762 RepID=A0A8J6BN30_ZIZPA|nr:hypothetical protein GUJ93_ZPchr0011g27047 [Zizania palustris]
MTRRVWPHDGAAMRMVWQCEGHGRTGARQREGHNQTATWWSEGHDNIMEVDDNNYGKQRRDHAFVFLYMPHNMESEEEGKPSSGNLQPPPMVALPIASCCRLPLSPTVLTGAPQSRGVD